VEYLFFGRFGRDIPAFDLLSLLITIIMLGITCYEDPQKNFNLATLLGLGSSYYLLSHFTHHLLSLSNYNMPLKPVDMIESDLLEQLKEVGFLGNSEYYPTYALADWWFREVHYLKYSVDWMPNIQLFTFHVTNMKSSVREFLDQRKSELFNGIPRFQSYEEARRAAFMRMIEKVMPLQLRRETRINRILSQDPS
jgi:hypothetical protein